jgi:hypothetical protein
LETCIDSCRKRPHPFANVAANDSQIYGITRSYSRRIITKYDPAPVNLLRLYADTKLYAIALTPDLSSANHMQLSEAHLKALICCLQTVRSSFEALLSLPLCEYRNFSMSEWTRFIHSVIILFQICSVTSTVPQWNFGPEDQRKQFGIYFESLSFRMGELSEEKDDSAPPTPFCMFKAVLPLVRETYVDLIEKLLPDPSPIGTTFLGASSASIRHCPILGRQIIQTDYWELLGNTSSMYAETHNSSSGSEGYNFISQLSDWDTWENGTPIGNDFTDFGTSSGQK